MRKLKSCILIFSVSLLLLVISGSQSPLFAKDDISVSQDKDKTVYTIDSTDEGGTQQERERAEALEILKNIPIVVDGRQNKPMPRQSLPQGPAQALPPAPTK